jgi:hypothetical protein
MKYDFENNISVKQLYILWKASVNFTEEYMLVNVVVKRGVLEIVYRDVIWNDLVCSTVDVEWNK